MRVSTRSARFFQGHLSLCYFHDGDGCEGPPACESYEPPIQKHPEWAFAGLGPIGFQSHSTSQLIIAIRLVGGYQILYRQSRKNISLVYMGSKPMLSSFRPLSGSRRPLWLTTQSKYNTKSRTAARVCEYPCRPFSRRVHVSFFVQCARSKRRLSLISQSSLIAHAKTSVN